MHSKSLGILLCIFLSMSLAYAIIEQNNYSQKTAFQFVTDEDIEIKVLEVSAPDGALQMYKATVKTPICEDKVCYDVELFFYWNLVGDFINYEIIPNKPLTKIKHQTFSEADYNKLTEILTNKQAVFYNLKKDELTTKIENVDGVSGATINSIKEQSIQGAVYSCYTLWHIANGIVVDSIRNHTSKMLEKKVVNSIVAINNSNADVFLINNFNSIQFKQFTSEILDLIKRNDWSFTKNAIEKMPTDVLLTSQTQFFFTEQYLKMDYFAQISLLKKLQNQKLNNDLLNSFIDVIDNDTYKNELIFQLINYNSIQISDKTLSMLLKSIVDKSLQLNKQMTQTILLITKSRKTLKSEFADFKDYLDKK